MPSITATPGHPDSAGKVTTECPTGCRVTVTAYTDGLTKTVPGAELELKLTSGASAKATADDRAVVTFVIADLSGTEGFTITATYPGSKTPRVNQIAQQAEAAALLTANAQCAPMPVLKMYLDVDRDGKVDGKPADNAHWTWGKAGKGAVLLVNKRDDYEMGDTVVERTEVAFRWAPKGPGRPVDLQAGARAEQAPAHVRRSQDRRRRAAAGRRPGSEGRRHPAGR